MNQVLSVLQIVSAAAIGAGFHALWTVHGYIKDRTYDPRYNNAYVIRFVVGIVAGTILGYALGNLPEIKALELGTTILAILGGWSADAVAQLLQRLSDTLVAAIRGPETAKTDVEREKARAEAQRMIQRRQAQALKKLRDAKESAVVSNAPPATLGALQQAIDELEPTGI